MIERGTMRARERYRMIERGRMRAREREREKDQEDKGNDANRLKPSVIMLAGTCNNLLKSSHQKSF